MLSLPGEAPRARPDGRWSCRPNRVSIIRSPCDGDGIYLGGGSKVTVYKWWSPSRLCQAEAGHVGPLRRVRADDVV